MGGYTIRMQLMAVLNVSTENITLELLTFKYVKRRLTVTEVLICVAAKDDKVRG